MGTFRFMKKKSFTDIVVLFLLNASDSTSNLYTHPGSKDRDKPSTSMTTEKRSCLVSGSSISVMSGNGIGLCLKFKNPKKNKKTHI